MDRFKAKLLEVMRSLHAAEDHIASEKPELAAKIRSLRKKVEDCVFRGRCEL